MIIWKDYTPDSIVEEGVKYLVQYADGTVVIENISAEDITYNNNKKIKYSELNTENPKLNVSCSVYGDSYDFDVDRNNNYYYLLEDGTISTFISVSNYSD